LSRFTDKHTAILYKHPKIVKSFTNVIDKLEIVKIMPIAKNNEEHRLYTKTFQPFAPKLCLRWGKHPLASRCHFGIITARNISKEQAVSQIANYYKIPFAKILGVGDQMIDWQFIKLCKYKGAMGNASQELKILIKKSANSYIGSDVDNNGILKIFEHIKLRYN
jgi:hydroxymethylpyrimidine pyrophosphatase-like HAD family hydrolase